jgi:outer membrane murein-binding lipoprotein Lpp
VWNWAGRGLAVVLTASVLAALLLAGCGERPQVIEYKQGVYQGKPDEQPWAAAPFNGNKEQWEREVRARAQFQNEYKRIGS